MDSSSSSSSQWSPPISSKQQKPKQGLGWMEWIRGWFQIFYEIFFQRISASHLQNPLPLHPLNQLTCIVTGSTSGIGLQIARQLAEAGAHVVMAVRNVAAGNELVRKWQSEWSGMGLPLNIEVMELDLLSLGSVVNFAEAWNARSGPLNVLINNAGIFALGAPQKFSKDGYEHHMQVNHLAPALLSILLLPSLIRGSPSRIVNVNSVTHFVGFVDPEDMNVMSGKRKYSSLVGYSSSKLAQIMFSSILHKRLPAEAGINVVCLSPGIVLTNVARDIPNFLQTGYRLIPYFMFDPQEGKKYYLISFIFTPQPHILCQKDQFTTLSPSHHPHSLKVLTTRNRSIMDHWERFESLHHCLSLRHIVSISKLDERWKDVEVEETCGSWNTTLMLPHFSGSRSSLFAATDEMVPEYCALLKSDDWPVCAYISHDCRPMNASEEAHNLETSNMVWAKTLELTGLPSDAVEKLLEGDQVECRFGLKED